MPRKDLLELSKLLHQARDAANLTQEDAASLLEISRKTYLLLESTRWLPQPTGRAHFARKLRAFHPPAADEFARILASMGAEEVETPVEAQTDPASAKLVFDAALLALAEQLDVTAKVLRPAVAEFLGALSAGGVSMGQARAVATRAPATR